MVCKVCGAELKDDQMYCPACGEEIHLVSFYNPEDDFQLDMDVVNPKAKIEPQEESAVKTSDDSKLPIKISKKTLIIILSSIIVVGLIVVFIINYFINKNDYTYQYNKANTEYNNANFKAASEYALQASKLNKSSSESRWLLISAYEGMNDYDSILPVLTEIFEIESYDIESLTRGIELFLSVDDYRHAANVLEATTDKNFRNKYKEYIASAPTFSEEGGTYNHEVQLEMKCDGKCKIYYTIDENEPLDGSVYKSPVTIKAGDHTVRAVSVNEFGVASAETKASFSISPDAPDMPEINKPSGNIGNDETIVISGPQGCKFYYTWDGSEPTAQSELYTEPIKAPAGNNILSVIAIDSYGQISSVARKNFICNENVEE